MGWFGDLGKISTGELRDLVSKGFSQFLPARVISINQSTSLSNGEIVAEILTPLATRPNQTQLQATPLFSNIKTYPLVNEVVFLLTAPAGDYSSNTGNIKYYYLSTLNIWNNVHVNPTPNPFQNLKPDSQNKSIAEVEAGSSNKSGEQDTNEFRPGNYFEEKSNIYPLYPFEGDIIYEGRWGQSIRFGSTFPNLNTWSDVGQAGDPILIFRNGQNPELSSPAQSTTEENINRDLSSMYFTSTQKIPIEVSSQNEYASYGNNKPTEPKEYTGPQAILNSGRLLFNSTQDHIMLSSRRSINLNATEGIYTDTTGDTVFQSNKVFLGGTKESQPVILGDELVSLLTDILDDLSSLTTALSTQVGVPAGTPLAPTNLKASVIIPKIPVYKQRLKNSLSKTTSTV
jgi:hypothetical protein